MTIISGSPCQPALSVARLLAAEPAGVRVTMASTPLIDADELLGVPKPAAGSRHTCYLFDGAYWTAVFTIVNAALGAGILAYPSAVRCPARARPLRARALSLIHI
eukprot:959148-Prymnesium_polylepis.1